VDKSLDNASDTERGKILISLCYHVQQGALLVNVKRCAELIGLDSTGFSDPYVKMYMIHIVSYMIEIITDR
jgi:hypothetical protein